MSVIFVNKNQEEFNKIMNSIYSTVVSDFTEKHFDVLTVKTDNGFELSTFCALALCMLGVSMFDKFLDFYTGKKENK